MLMFLCLLVELSVDHRLWLSWVYGTLIFAAVVSVLAVRIETPRRRRARGSAPESPPARAGARTRPSRKRRSMRSDPVAADD
jgi:hypothetical protein